MKKNLSNYIYVCPQCVNELKNCKCDDLPSSLVRIGRKIRRSIKLLDEKWYLTETCSEGLIGDGEQIRIVFLKTHHFSKEIPEGFIQSEHILYANIRGDSDAEKAEHKEKLLAALHRWATSLPDKNPKNMRYIPLSF